MIIVKQKNGNKVKANLPKMPVFFKHFHPLPLPRPGKPENQI